MRLCSVCYSQRLAEHQREVRHIFCRTSYISKQLLSELFSQTFLRKLYMYINRRMNTITSALHLNCNQLAQKTFYRNYNLNYRKKYEDVKVGNDSGKFHKLETFLFCLLIFMTTAFNFVKTNSVTRQETLFKFEAPCFPTS